MGFCERELLQEVAWILRLHFGVIKGDKEDSTRTGKKLLDLNGDGHKDTFYSCSTAVGIQFSLWDRLAYKSHLIWSGYYYLGYDTEENCPPLPKNHEINAQESYFYADIYSDGDEYTELCWKSA